MTKSDSESRKFYKIMLSLAIPIMMQNFIMASLNIVDIFMVGALGEKAIAGVGLANQIFFVYILLMFGITSGGAVFTAQYWGNNDIGGIKRVLGVTLIAGCAGALIFTAGALVFPEWLISLFSKDEDVIRLGGEFLYISGFSYILSAVSIAYSFQLRSVGRVKMPMAVTFIALGINTVLNYCLIFGKFGFPEMGVRGSALATLISRIIEFGLILFLVYRFKYPLAAKWKELMDFDFQFLIRFFRTSMPVILNELIWAAGVTIYSMVYARMSTESIAAMQIFSSVERITFVIFFGITHACAIMIGNKIGANESGEALDYSRRFVKLSLLLGIGVGLFMAFLAPKIVFIFPMNVTDNVKTMTNEVLAVFGFITWAKVTNMMFVVGVFRGGGDTKFAFAIDAGGIWLIGVPLAILTGMVLNLPLWIVFLALSTEEFFKLVFGIWRFKSKKWIKNVIN